MSIHFLFRWPSSMLGTGALVAAAALLAAACTSAASGDASTTTGIVTGSPLRHAKVCIDANGNGRCDGSEASTTTDDRGAFRLPGRGPVVAEIPASSRRIDPRGGGSVAGPALVFRAPMAANAVVSPLSTELAALADANGGKLDTALDVLAARLGVSPDQLLLDPDKIGDARTRTVLQTESDQSIARIAEAVAEAGSSGSIADALRNRFALDAIRNVVVIYAENRAFDTLYGLYPGADGIPGVNPASKADHIEPQKDFDGAVLPVLPPVWNGVTVAGQSTVITQAQTVGMPNRMFRIDDPAGFFDTGIRITQATVTRDLVHRFYNNQMQIAGGSNDRFAAYSDAGALSMGYFDGSGMRLWKIARQYTLADNFFMGSFGGSFLNHVYLVCACVPTYPNADAPTSPVKGSISAIDTDANGNFLRLTPAANSPRSVLDGAAVYLHDGGLTPKDAKGLFHVVNTMQPPYQPSGNAPAAADGSGKLADPAKPNTLPPQTAQTIGDMLDAKGLSWAWYAGAWNDALKDRKQIYNNAVPNFQPHHQPFNYYERLDPLAHPAYRASHLKDFEADFLSDLAAGKLPAVSFYKPQGNLNQHSGYANLSDGDAHIADLIARLQASPQWKSMLVVVTYDENGGFYDHAPVPRGDRWGPGSRVPTLVVSPFAKKGFVDKTPYDSASILRFITHRWSLQPLPGLIERDQGLMRNGNPPMGDLTSALDFGLSAGTESDRRSR